MTSFISLPVITMLILCLYKKTKHKLSKIKTTTINYIVITCDV